MTSGSSAVRREVREGDIRWRGEGMDPARLRGIRRGLRTLHTLELMAAAIYRFQIGGERSEHNRLLVAAMCNEMTHLQDFQVALYEYASRPSRVRAAYLVPAFLIGAVSRMMGRRAVLRAGIWVEAKAVRHYGELLETIDWDDDTRKVIESDRADEEGHIATWRRLLGEDDGEEIR